WKGIAFTGAYTWSHMLDNASEVFGPGLQRTSSIAIQGPLQQFSGTNLSESFEPSTPLPQNPSNPGSGERGSSSFDRRHRFAFSVAWALPAAGPERARILFGDWQLNLVSALQSGQPYTPINSSVASSGGFSNIPGLAIGGFPSFGCGDA